MISPSVSPSYPAVSGDHDDQVSSLDQDDMSESVSMTGGSRDGSVVSSVRMCSRVGKGRSRRKVSQPIRTQNLTEL